MGKNDSNKVFPNTGKYFELEKFKRRLIRAVARMLLHEKRNEDEVWAGLKQETGCDCKVLWNRMHALTMKKLKRLLDAQDRNDLLPKAARMSITDWLLFDHVIVHEDFDVIGLTETTVKDRPVLVDLFNLVEKYKIEFRAGDKLAAAWTRLTAEYNKNNRRCSPMLLQRRWYQLKLATRGRFYKFWCSYKGQIKRLSFANQYKPTPLQTEIAKTYKTIVVSRFVSWEELIEYKLVILPEEFAPKSSKQTNDNIPDVMCVESKVETINLDMDSDTELEYRKDVDETKEELTPVKVKEEPKDFHEMNVDENVPYQNRQEKISNFAEAVMEATAQELDEMELEEDINMLIESNPGETPNEHITVEDNNKEISLNEKSVASEDVCSTNIVFADDDVIPVEEKSDEHVSVEVNTQESVDLESNAETSEPEPILPKITSVFGGNDVSHGQGSVDLERNAKTSEPEPILPKITSIFGGTDVSHGQGSVDLERNAKTSEPEPILPKITSIFGGTDVSHGQGSVDLESNAKTSEPDPILPKITSIFGGIDVSNETLSKIGMLTAEITKPKTVVEKDDEITQETNRNDETIELSSDEKDDTCDSIPVVVKKEVDIKPNINSTWFGELSDDIVFADDGIQLLDDGIACHDDEFEYKIDAIKTEVETEVDEEKCEITPIDEEESDDTPKVDKKLLMLPVVSTMKLDDMGILPIDLLQQVDNKTIIDMIHFKSKLIVKKETDDSSTESSEEEVVEDIKKVKLTSVLLQKPRSRTYNPIQVCKNPDFNTRLKRLTVGFFSSTRNRYLLKSCNPVTIDLSKAFESRLVNGTMYLKVSETDELSKSDDAKESNTVSITPSAMPVQSLIDNIDVKNSEENRQAAYSPIISNPLESLACERNKVINLPDISEIRRINQKLLTAQVTPLQLKNNCPDVPVTIVPGTSIEDSYRPNTKVTGRHIAGPASRTRVAPPTVVDITKEDTVNPNSSTDTQAPNAYKNKDTWKKGDKIVPWKSRQIRPDIPWFIKINNIQDVDALLALDTLNKMLYLLSDEGNAESLVKKNKWKWKKNLGTEKKDGRETVHQYRRRKSKKKLPDPLPSETNKIPIDVDDNDDVEVVSESKPECSEDTTSTEDKTKTDTPNKLTIYQPTCCWARERINQIMYPKICISTHGCAFPLCMCCCKQALADFFRMQKTQSNIMHEQQDKLDIRIEKVVSGEAAEIISMVQQAGESASSSLHIEDGIQSKITNQIANLSENVEGNKAIADVPCREGFRQSEEPVKSNIPATEEGMAQVDDACSQIDNNLGMKIVIESSESPKINLESNDRDSADTGLAEVQPIPTKAPRFLVSHANRKNATKPNKQIRDTSLKGKSIPENEVKVSTESKNVTDNLQGETSSYKLVTNLAQRKITIDNGTSNFLPIIAPKPSPPPPKTYVNQRLIYLNRKLSESSSDNPIFLGKNKILLTTAKFPPNFKAFEELQRTLKQTQTIPKGIQLILQPDGKLTYIRLPRAVINEAFTVALPLLITAFQQHIDEHVPVGVEKPVITNAQTEVIDLSDDETPKKRPENDESNEAANEVQVTGKPSETSQESPMIQIDNLDVTQKENLGVQNDGLSSEQNGNSNVSHNECSETKQIDNVEVAQSTENSLNAVELINEVDLTSINSRHTSTAKNILPQAEESISTNAANITVTPHIDIMTEEKNANVDPKETEISSIQNTENEANETCSGKTKNILSDLMAMSGIGPIDVSPTQHVPPAPISPDIPTPQQIPDASMPFSVQNPPPLVNIDVRNNVTAPSNNSLLLEALTAITSLSELKYACAQNGAFFKLDFDTGVLVPINVCMKKLTQSSHARNTRKNSESPSKPVIDLTDDDICDVTDVVEPAQVKEISLLKNNQNTKRSVKDKNTLPNNKEIVKPLKLFKSTRPVAKRKIVKINAAEDTMELDSNTTFTIDNQSDDANVVHGTITNMNSAGEVKPLKLFKFTSNTRQPNILRKKLKEIHKKISDAMSAQDLIRRKLKRKQELRVNSMDDDDGENGLTNMGVKSASDCSSDEEPLAKKAKKKRAIEKENTESNEDVNEKLDEQDRPEDIVVDSEVMTTDEAKNVELGSDPNLLVPLEDEEEDMTLEVLDEAALDADEDCILGF